jgi:2'-5' RNA ligase
MFIDYVENITHWESWQQSYRFGVLLIFPPDPPSSEVNNLRSQHDPQGQAICQAHISLTVPLPKPINLAQLNELRTIASGIKPFLIHYGPLSNYLPAPGVVLAIQPQDKIDGLRIALESASAFEGVPVRKYPFSAHMTIAEFITVEKTMELMTKLRGLVSEGDFMCDSVSYTVPDASFHFTERLKLELEIGR